MAKRKRPTIEALRRKLRKWRYSSVTRNENRRDAQLWIAVGWRPRDGDTVAGYGPTERAAIEAALKAAEKTK